MIINVENDEMLGRTNDKALHITLIEQQKEIERLNNELENVKIHYETEAEAKYYEFIDNHESKLQQKIDKAIEYIENNDDEWFSAVELIGILKGEDNE